MSFLLWSEGPFFLTRASPLFPVRVLWEFPHILIILFNNKSIYLFIYSLQNNLWWLIWHLTKKRAKLLPFLVTIIIFLCSFCIFFDFLNCCICLSPFFFFIFVFLLFFCFLFLTRKPCLFRYPLRSFSVCVCACVSYLLLELSPLSHYLNRIAITILGAPVVV